MALGVTRIGATQTQAMIDDFRARKAGLAVAGAAGAGAATARTDDHGGY